MPAIDIEYEGMTWCVEWYGDTVILISLYADNAPAWLDGKPTFSNNIEWMLDDEVRQELLRVAKKLYEETHHEN